MESDRLDLKPRTPIKVAAHFLIGAACGLAIAIVFLGF
jgi:hypothetical protein